MKNKKLPNFKDTELRKCFASLDDLRNSGCSNMFGARNYVMACMGWAGDKSGKALALWMQTFGSCKTMLGRIAKAQDIMALKRRAYAEEKSL